MEYILSTENLHKIDTKFPVRFCALQLTISSLDYKYTLKEIYLSLERSLTYKIKIVNIYCSKVDSSLRTTHESYPIDIKGNESCQLKCTNIKLYIRISSYLVEHKPKAHLTKFHCDIIMVKTITVKEFVFEIIKAYKYIDDLHHKICENNVISKIF
ncbi:hypothetical protein HZS_5904 [Henneguya salminicola]|nr:hypothetical protein HZS_5904 [Henneguya salminicola]